MQHCVSQACPSPPQSPVLLAGPPSWRLHTANRPKAGDASREALLPGALLEGTSKVDEEVEFKFKQSCPSEGTYHTGDETHQSQPHPLSISPCLSLVLGSGHTGLAFLTQMPPSNSGTLWSGPLMKRKPQPLPSTHAFCPCPSQWCPEHEDSVCSGVPGLWLSL